MEVIKIIFFALGTFFGNQTDQIAAEKTTITIDDSIKTITIVQENVFALIRTEADSISVREFLIKITTEENNWSTELENYPLKKVAFKPTENHQLNASITLTYIEKKDLKAFGIDIDNELNYSIIDIPRLHLTTEDGFLDGNYWNFKPNKNFTFTVQPFKELPSEYKAYKKSLLHYLEEIKN